MGLDLDAMALQELGLNPIQERLLDVYELTSLAPPEPLVGEVLSKGSLAVLYGRWGTFKSFIALDWSMCVGSGLPWQGREVRGGPVLYVAAEGQRGMAKRARAWMQQYPNVVPEVFFHPAPVDLLRASEVRHLVSVVEQMKPALVVFDTLNRSMGGGEENSSSDMGKALAAATAVQAASEATVLIIHHTGKDGDLRGHSSLPGAADHIIKTWVPEDNSDGIVLLYSRKTKDDEPFDPIRLRTRKVFLPDGDSSLVVTAPGWSP